MIYLDYAATAPMTEEALAAYTEANRQFYGNASSLHDIGSEAAHVLGICREVTASLLNGEPEGVYFTSGGTEANTLAIRSILEGNRERGSHIVTTELEHSSVYHLCKRLETEGYDVTYVPVDRWGRVIVDELEASIRPCTVLAAIGHANPEIGTIQPIKEIGAILRRHGVLFHSDCVQTFGKIPVDVKAAGIDSLSISSHKIGGPKGVGACYISPAVKWAPQLPGTTHENGFRPGTVNVPGIVAFTEAAQSAAETMASSIETYETLRASLLDGLAGSIVHWTVEGHPEERLPHIAGLRFTGIQGQFLLLECNRYGLAISTGTACQIGKQHPSRTMLATGKTEQEAKELTRLSFGPSTTMRQIEQTVRIFGEILRKVPVGS